MSHIAFTYVVIITILYIISQRKSKEKTRQAAITAARSLKNLALLLVCIFILAGLFQSFFPPETIESMLGSQSGLSSLLIGGLLGSVAIGPPIAAFPVAGTLLDKGAWPPAIAAFIVSWMLVGVITIPFEAEIFGFRFALLRNAVAFCAALLIGLGIGMVL